MEVMSVLLALFHCLRLKLGIQLSVQGGTDGMGCVQAQEPDCTGNDFQGGASSFLYVDGEPN